MKKIVLISVLINLVLSCSNDSNTAEPKKKENSLKSEKLVSGKWGQVGEWCIENASMCDSTYYLWDFKDTVVVVDKLRLELDFNNDTAFISGEPYLVERKTKDSLILNMIRVGNRLLLVKKN